MNITLLHNDCMKEVIKLEDIDYKEFWEYNNFINRQKYFKQFRYCIVSENDETQHGTIINKIFEVYLAGSIPVVFDPLDICQSYYNRESYVKLDDIIRYKPVKQIIEDINNNKVSSYFKKPLFNHIPDIFSIFGENTSTFWNSISSL